MAHSSISRAIVVGLKDKHYGEVVAAFVEHTKPSQQTQPQPKPTDADLRDWVRSALGKHKAPAYVFWLGEGDVPAHVPLTGSGKVRKFEMAKLGEEIAWRRRRSREGKL